MKRLIFGVIYSVLVAVIEFFLAMQLAYFASFHNDLAAYMHAPRICWDPNILYWQGNKLFFNKIMIIIGISVACTLLSSLFRSSRIDRERKARERNMTAEERKYFSHIATHAEAKKGLVRLHFDYKGMLDHMYFYKESCYTDLKWWIGITSLVVQMICLFLMIPHGIQWIIQQFSPDYHLPAVVGTVRGLLWIEGICIGIAIAFSIKFMQPNYWQDLKEYRDRSKENGGTIFNVIREFLRMLIPHIRDYFDYILNPFRHLYNKMIVDLKMPDDNKINELKAWDIDNKTVTRKGGVPILTWRRGAWVDAENNHTIIIGTTNAGKTVSVIEGMIEISRMSGHSMIINDLKGELLGHHQASLERDGYNVIVLNFVHPEEGVSWNPFGLVIKRYREAQEAMMNGFASQQQKESYIMKRMELLKKNKILSDLYANRDALDKKLKKTLDEPIAKMEKEIESIKEALVQEILSDSFPKPDFSEAFELLNDITRALCEEKDSKQPFFWQQAKSIMEGIICFLLEYEYIDADGKLQHLNDEQINFQNIKLLKEEGFRYVQVNGRPRLLLKYYLDYYRLKIDKSRGFLETITADSCAEETRSNVFQTFDNHMALGTLNEKIGNMMCRTSFDFNMIAKEKTAVFMVVHDEKKTYYPFVTLFVSQFYNEVVKTSREFEEQQLPIPVDIIWDEFGISPALNDPDNMLSASRFRGVRWNLVLQDYSQLNKNYDKDVAKAIRNNMLNTIYLLGGDPDTLDFVSRMCGKTLKWNKERGSFDTVPVISPDRLRRLSLSEAVIIRQRRNPIITRYTPYFKYIFYKNRKGVAISKKSKNTAKYKIFSLLDDFNHRGDNLTPEYFQTPEGGIAQEVNTSVLDQLNQQKINGTRS